MTQFTENLRYDCDFLLNPEALVIDVGFFEGEFSRRILEKYPCRVIAFEPQPELFAAAQEHPRLQLFNQGLGAITGTSTFGVHGSMTGKFSRDPQSFDASILGVPDLLELLNVPKVELLKLNIEGMEFEVLETILFLNVASLFLNIQVQFHGVVPNANRRYQEIRSGLLATHHLTYDFPWCWENYALST